MKTAAIFLLTSMLTCGLYAAETHYGISPERPAKDMLSFSIPYTFGTHEGTIGALQAEVVTNEDDQVLRATFQVPINSMKTGNAERDCHMIEALGIDYTQSRFPKEHICTNDNTLPESGPDSVQYPDIKVEFINMTLPKDPFSIGIPQISDVSVNMSIHGTTKVFKFEKVTLTKTINGNGAPGFRILTKLSLSLKDFNIQVKAAKIGPISINVKDKVSINVNIDLMRL